MEKLIALKKEIGNDVVVWSTGAVKIDKNTAISVPINYRVVALIDGKIAFRVDPCSEVNIIKEFGKELLKKQIEFIYVLSSAIPMMSWGFGNINVNNDRLKEAYRVGANGKYSIEIVDIPKLIKNFAGKAEITIDDIREKTVTIIKANGTQVVSKYFANTTTSVFEIDSKINEIRVDIKEALVDELLFKNFGLKMTDLIVEGIHVNEDDLQVIRDRLNG